MQLSNLVRSFAGLREQEPVFFFPKRSISLLFDAEVSMKAIDTLSEPFLVLAPDLFGNYPKTDGSILCITEGGMTICSSCLEKGNHKLSHREMVSDTDFHFCEACSAIIL